MLSILADQGISSISAIFYPLNVRNELLQQDKGRKYLSHELIEKTLANCMSMSMPLKTMDFTEGMETFDG